MCIRDSRRDISGRLLVGGERGGHPRTINFDIQVARRQMCIRDRDWSKSDDAAWRLLQSHPELKSDSDLGRRNRGITIVLL